MMTRPAALIAKHKALGLIKTQTINYNRLRKARGDGPGLFICKAKENINAKTISIYQVYAIFLLELLGAYIILHTIGIQCKGVEKHSWFTFRFTPGLRLYR